MSVICRWNGSGCGWGVRRDYEKDCIDALYLHLLAAHGHDVHAETEGTT
jgi:predicted small metal-binding protein